MSIITFSSPLGNFSDIVFGPDANELPQQLRGRIGSGKATTLTFQGSGMRERLSELQAIEAKRIAGGKPRMNLEGYADAVCDPGGQLVTVTLEEGSTLTETGIISIVEASVGPGGHLVQSLTLVFYPCTRLRFFGLSAVQSAV